MQTLSKRSLFFVKNQNRQIRRSLSIGGWFQYIKEEAKKFKQEWDEQNQIDTNLPEPFASDPTYYDVSPEIQKKIREEFWRMFALKEEAMVKEIEEYERKVNAAKEKSKEDTKDPRPIGMFEELINRAKNEVQANSIKSNKDEDLLGIAMSNKEVLQKAAVSRLETLQEIISDFNDSYFENKNKAIDEVLAKEDYLEDLKNNLFKAAGIDPPKEASSPNSEERPSSRMNENAELKIKE